MGKVPKAPGVHVVNTKRGKRRVRRFADGSVRFLPSGGGSGGAKPRKTAKKRATRAAPKNTAPRRARRNPSNPGNPKRSKKTMATKQRRPAGAVNPDAIMFGALGGAASNVLTRVLGPFIGPLAGPAGAVGAGALLPDSAEGRRVRDALQTVAGVEFGSGVADLIPVPQIVPGFGAGGNGNGNARAARSFL